VILLTSLFRAGLPADSFSFSWIRKRMKTKKNGEEDRAKIRVLNWEPKASFSKTSKLLEKVLNDEEYFRFLSVVDHDRVYLVIRIKINRKFFRSKCPI